MHVAAIESTLIVGVSRALSGRVKTVAIIPHSDGMTVSHQADVTPDGKNLGVTDEAGGGLSNTDCNATPQGFMGACFAGSTCTGWRGNSGGYGGSRGLTLFPGQTLYPRPALCSCA